MGNSGLFGWLAIGLIAAGLCGAGIRWLREDAVADLRREIAIETQRVRQAAQVKAAETAAQSEHEALAAEAADAERERRFESLTLTIAELEGKNSICGFISRDTVRALNASR